MRGYIRIIFGIIGCIAATLPTDPSYQNFILAAISGSIFIWGLNDNSIYVMKKTLREEKFKRMEAQNDTRKN